jgi:thioredoxin-like negative regulator of GroEL
LTVASTCAIVEGMNQVVVFHMRSCEPCREYLPRFKKQAVKYRSHLHIRTIDVSVADKRVQDVAIQFKIDATPTTLVLDENDIVLKRKTGGIADKEIEKLLDFATKASGS